MATQRSRPAPDAELRPGFALVWRLERDVLVLDESLEVTEWTSPPRQRRLVEPQRSPRGRRMCSHCRMHPSTARLALVLGVSAVGLASHGDALSAVSRRIGEFNRALARG